MCCWEFNRDESKFIIFSVFFILTILLCTSFFKYEYKQIEQKAEVVIPPRYINELRSVRNKEALRDNNQVLDVYKRSKDEPGKPRFVSQFSGEPFGALVIPKTSMAILKEENSKQRRNKRPPIRAFMDMTFGIVATLSEEPHKSMGNTNLIINLVTGNRHSTIPICLAEHITNTPNIISVKPAMEYFIDQYKHVSPTHPKPFSQVVTDKCWVQLTALIEGLNKTSIQDYTESAFRAFQGDTHFFSRYITILLCSSHTAKTLSTDLLAAYKIGQLTFDEYRFLRALLGYLYEIKDAESCDSYVAGLFTLLCTKYVTEDVK